MNIVIAGAGSFGTSLGHILAVKDSVSVYLLARRKETVDAINSLHVNEAYFPNFRLNENLVATTDRAVLGTADVLFLALPSTVVIEYLTENQDLVNVTAVLVVLSKGFGKNRRTILESAREVMRNPIVSLKGPTFAADLIHNNPSAFTVASEDERYFAQFRRLFKETNIYLDFSTDLTGVEIASALKNIYAILLGIIDAYFNSANVRFLILTRAFSELKEALAIFGGREETMFRYCGFGDFGLTALNDLSRNRTLGLLIGKGFMNSDTSNSVILEGQRTLSEFHRFVRESGLPEERFFMLNELHRLFYSEYSVHSFIKNLFEKIRTYNSR
jgi:glycerol-3-phosphate dehydrogenase (NAD(P)+)